MSSSKTKFIPEAITTTIDQTAEVSGKGFDKTLAAIKESVEKASKGFETSHAKMKANVEKAVKTAEEMMAFSQGNLEAFVKATQIYSAGFQSLSKHLATSNKTALDESVAFTKSMMGMKSVKEAVDLHSGFARTAMEKAVAETGKITDATVKLTEEALAPLTARMKMAVEKFGKTS